KIFGLHQWVEKSSGESNVDDYVMGVLNNPTGGISTHFAAIQIGLLGTLLLATPWNLVCWFFGISWGPIWLYGFLALGVLALIISSYIAPTERTKYLKDFKRFESLPKGKRRLAAFASLSVYLFIWVGFLASFAYYLHSQITSG